MPDITKTNPTGNSIVAELEKRFFESVSTMDLSAR